MKHEIGRLSALLGLDVMCECGHDYGLHSDVECTVFECECRKFRQAPKMAAGAPTPESDTGVAGTLK